jgi:surface antigen
MKFVNSHGPNNPSRQSQIAARVSDSLLGQTASRPRFIGVRAAVILLALVCFVFQAQAQTPAVMTYPSNGSTLYTASVTFQWTTGVGVNDHWLYVGTAFGQSNIFNAELGMATSQTVNGIPTGPVYARVWTRIGGGWWYNDYSYAETAGGGSPAVLTSPTNQSTLTSSSATFQWTSGVGANDHWLYVGTALGQANIFGNELAMATNQLVSGLPNGALYVRLWTRIGSTWFSNDYSFTVSVVGDDYPWKTAPADTVNSYTHFYIRECTDFVAWRMNRDTGHTNPTNFWFTDWMPSSNSVWGNAANWETHAQTLGYRVDSSPAVGAVAYFSFGHVAYVESVNADESVNVSEYNYNLNHLYGYRTSVRNVTAFIHIVR